MQEPWRHDAVVQPQDIGVADCDFMTENYRRAPRAARGGPHVRGSQSTDRGPMYFS